MVNPSIRSPPFLGERVAFAGLVDFGDLSRIYDSLESHLEGMEALCDATGHKNPRVL